MRRRHLGISVGGGVQIEHELDQGALEARAGADEQREPGARHARGALEIEESEGFAEGHMVPGLEVEGGFLPPLAHHDIGRGIVANRHALVGQIGNRQQQGALLLLDLPDRGVERRDLLAHLAGLALDFRGVLAGLLQGADFFGDLLALVLQAVALGDGGATALVELQHGGEIHRGTAALQPGADKLGVLADQLDIEHGALSAIRRWPAGPVPRRRRRVPRPDPPRSDGFPPRRQGG